MKLSVLARLFVASITARFCVSASYLPSEALENLDNDAREILERATPVAPHFVVYADAYDGTTGPPNATLLKVKAIPSDREPSLIALFRV